MHKIRLITFNTGLDIDPIKKRSRAQNKRFTYLITAPGVPITQKQMVSLIRLKIDEFYEFDKFPKLIIFGDGAKWIRSLPKHFKGSVYIADKFHSYRLLGLTFLANRRKDMQAREIYNQAIKLFNAGDFDNFFKILVENKVKKTTINYFKKIKEGIRNQNLEYNIGCSAESDVHHLVKSMCSGSRIFGLQHFENMLFEKSKKLNNIF